MKSTTFAFAAAATLALSNADEYFTGDGTAYTLGDTSAGNCNYMKALGFASNNYAALNDKQWNGLKNCGRCAEVSCADSRCADQSKSIVVQILDRCPECQYGDLDLSPSVFSALTGSSPSRYKVKWKFVDCPVQGNVNYCLKGGSNNYWTAIQPTNVPTGVTDLQINGKSTKMLDGAYYYLLDGSGQQIADLSSVTVSLTDLSGNSVKETVSLSAGSCTEGSRQFQSSSAGGSPSVPVATTPTTNTSTPLTPTPTAVPTETPSAPPATSLPPTPATTIPTWQQGSPSTPAPTAQSGAPTTTPTSQQSQPNPTSGSDATQTAQQYPYWQNDEGDVTQTAQQNSWNEHGYGSPWQQQ